MGFQSTDKYIASRDLQVAVNAAIALERPLLIKGEPGTGKTVLAHEIAKSLDTDLLQWHVKSTTKAQQGLYEYDAVARLRDSQLGDDKVHDIKNYIKRGKLWEAFTHQKRPVLLIDEIDKADPSLPNSLLEVLGNGGFEVPLAKVTVGKQEVSSVEESSDEPSKEQRIATTPDNAVQPRTSPLVIITTNDERELPPAFVRRCLVLHLKIPEGQDDEGKDKLIEWLKARVRVHIAKEECSDKVLNEAAKQLKEDREKAESQGIIKAGLAEYIDLITALVEMTEAGDNRETEQLNLLEEVAEFSLRKADA